MLGSDACWDVWSPDFPFANIRSAAWSPTKYHVRCGSFGQFYGIAILYDLKGIPIFAPTVCFAAIDYDISQGTSLADAVEAHHNSDCTASCRVEWDGNRTQCDRVRPCDGCANCMPPVQANGLRWL